MVKFGKLKLFSFLFPFVAVLLIFALMGMYPAGTKTMLTVDLYHQYMPFIYELRAKILGGRSLFYSWNGGTRRSPCSRRSSLQSVRDLLRCSWRCSSHTSTPVSTISSQSPSALLMRCRGGFLQTSGTSCGATRTYCFRLYVWDF